MRAIDADALIAQMEADAEQMEDMIFKMATYAAINDVKHQPTVTERTGHWIPYDTDNEAYDDYKCSACGNRITVDAERKCDIGFVIEDFDHCNKCGAHMIEEDK